MLALRELARVVLPHGPLIAAAIGRYAVLGESCSRGPSTPRPPSAWPPTPERARTRTRTVSRFGTPTSMRSWWPRPSKPAGRTCVATGLWPSDELGLLASLGREDHLGARVQQPVDGVLGEGEPVVGVAAGNRVVQTTTGVRSSSVRARKVAMPRALSCESLKTPGAFRSTAAAVGSVRGDAMRLTRVAPGRSFLLRA